MTGIGSLPRIDQSKASISRVYDALLDGKDHYPVDEKVHDQLRAAMPKIGDLAKLNREIRGRGVRYLAGEVGLRQYLDLGAGLPTAENTHQIAQSLQPGAHVVYVDNDPIVLAHGRAMLQENADTVVVTADLRHPDMVLEHPDVRRLIDFGQPVAIMLVGVLNYLHDKEDPAGVVDGYLNAVPSGSHLFITHFYDCGPQAQLIENAFLHSLGTGRFRTQDQIHDLFRGLDLVDPGLVYLPQWRPNRIVRDKPTVIERLMVGGIARKP
ncbi:SAM-dependent methyltransferase [Nocardia sp. NPDC049707]|uniref:SAM-dependent methyltransferase n=1 Tax=Nocardia sp. NPDC049707 TaxID=3154735 RepID=UPI00344820EA